MVCLKDNEIGINKIILEGRNVSRSRVIRKFAKTYSKNSDFQCIDTNRATLPDPSNPKEDTKKRLTLKKLGQLKSNDPLSNTGSSTRDILAGHKSGERKIQRVKTLLNLHDVNSNKLTKIIDKQDGIIRKISKENKILETELKSLKRQVSKPLAKTLNMKIDKNINSKKIGPETTLISRTKFKSEFQPDLPFNTKRQEKDNSLKYNPSMKNLTKKLMTGFNLMDDLKKCIMGIQYDVKVMEFKEKEKKKQIFGEDLDNLKNKIKGLVKIANKEIMI